MNFFIDALRSAFGLITSFDAELFRVVNVSLRVSLISTCVAGLTGVPVAFFVAFRTFWGKRVVITILNTLLALPTVVIGLFVYSLISRRGIFGPAGLLYTQTAIVIGQILLIVPVVTTLTISAISRIDERYHKTALTLGASRLQTAVVILREARFGIGAALILAFGRVIAEVGISMMLGGNIKGFTRTMTTAMALEYDKGDFVLSVALGIVLLVFSLALNGFFQYIQGRDRV